jgi:2-keto-4-pentenoate hydratase
MSLIRSRADSWNVDHDSIGSIGFSAGAEINVLLSVYQQAGDRQYPRIDDADDLSTRPDFNIAIYGGGFTEPGTPAMREDILSRLNERTPPMFVVHAFDDQALNSIILMNALARAKVVSELHIFGAGGHGFGVRDTGLPVGNWRELCFNWLRWQGFLDRPTVRTYASKLTQALGTNAAALPRFGDFDQHSDLDAAFSSQRRLVRHALAKGDQVAGYKGAYTSAAAQKAMNLNGPAHGVLFKSGQLVAATRPTIQKNPHRSLLVELEIGYVMATDIGTKLRVPRQAMTTVEAVVPVIELPYNASPLMGGNATARDAIAANIGSAQFIVGAPVAPATIGDLDSLLVSVQRNNQPLHAAKGGDVKGGQAELLMELINQIIDQGRVIRRGDIIIGGALGGAKPEEPGSYRADFGPLGLIEFTLE